MCAPIMLVEIRDAYKLSEELNQHLAQHGGILS